MEDLLVDGQFRKNFFLNITADGVVIESSIFIEAMGYVGANNIAVHVFTNNNAA